MAHEIEHLDLYSVIAELSGTYVRTSRDEPFTEHLNRVLKRGSNDEVIGAPRTFTATGETRGIILVDGPGAGKTSLVKNALSKHPALANCPPDRRLVVSANVPSPATLKSLGLEVLRATGLEDVQSNRQGWYYWQHVRSRLKMLGTAVLWIDEAHDLFNNGPKAEIAQNLKTLKSLMQGDSAVVVVLTGVEKLWEITSYDDQVKRRFSKIQLPAISALADGPVLERVITSYCGKAGLLAPVEKDLIPRLVYASRERFGLCIENTIYAIEVALRSGAERLTIQHFAETWFMQEGCTIDENVFLARNWSNVDLEHLVAA